MNKNIVKRQIACCIPTYNHPQVMKETLKACACVYQGKGVDIYIYDSSTDEETKNVVESFVLEGFKNLYYIGLDPSVGFDEKLIMIFSGYGLRYNYQYIWPVKDRSYVEEITVQAVLEETVKGYDAIFLTAGQGDSFNETVSEKVYLQKETFYADWGWLATSLDVTLFHVEDLLKGIDWYGFRDRYFFGGENLFDHFTVLFHGLAQKEHVSIGVISGKAAEIHSVDIGNSMSIKDIFKIWGRLWIQINHALPACYEKYKAATVYRAANLSWLLGSHTHLVKLKQQGILTEQVYEEIKDRWEQLSCVPTEELRMIAYGQLEECEEAVMNRINTFLLEERYQELERLYWYNSWLRKQESNTEYVFLGFCLEIYRRETEGQSLRSIFYHVWSHQEAVRKITYIMEMLAKIEHKIDEESWNGFKDFVINNRVSSECLGFLIDKCCAEKEQVVDRVVNLLEGRQSREK